MKNKKVKAIVISLLLIIGVAVLINGMRSRAIDAGMDPLAISQVEHLVEKGNIEVAITGSSSVTPTDKRTIRSEIDGTVDNIYVTEGDFVEKDQVLIALKSSSEGDDRIQIRDIDLNIERVQRELNDLYDSRGDLTIYADTKGVISNFNTEVGDEIGSNFNLGTIRDTGNSYIEAYFLKAHFEKINIGDSVDIVMPVYFASESGVVDDKDSTPVQMGGGIFGYKLIVKMENPGGYSVGDLAQVTVTNSGGSYEGMSNGKIIETKSENIISKVAGKVKSVSVENGQNVNKGDVIAVIEGVDMEHQIAEKQNQIERYKSQKEDLLEGDTIYSPMKGTVLQIDVSGDEVVDRTTALMTVADLDKMKAIIAVDELDITKVELGQVAHITCDAFIEEKFTGEVSKVSLEGVNQNGVTTYDLTIELDDRKQLMSGMNVDVEIIFESREDVLILPIEAVQRVDGEYIATVKDDSGDKTDVKVELGLVTDKEVEIINGLNEGDTVVYEKAQSEYNPFGMGHPQSVETGSSRNRPRGEE